MALSPEQFHELRGFETWTERVLHVLWWLISWSRNHYKDQGLTFCFQRVLTRVNPVREADGLCLVSHGSLHWFWGGFCFSFVFLTGRRVLFDRVIPLLFCLATKRVSNTFQNILDFTVLKKNLAFLVINSYVLPRTFLAMNILLK